MKIEWPTQSLACDRLHMQLLCQPIERTYSQTTSAFMNVCVCAGGNFHCDFVCSFTDLVFAFCFSFVKSQFFFLCATICLLVTTTLFDFRGEKMNESTSLITINVRFKWNGVMSVRVCAFARSCVFARQEQTSQSVFLLILHVYGFWNAFHIKTQYKQIMTPITLTSWIPISIAHITKTHHITSVANRTNHWTFFVFCPPNMPTIFHQ